MAIATGDVTFGADWQDSAGSQIIITLSGDNYRIQTYINYESPNYTITPNTDGI